MDSLSASIVNTAVGLSQAQVQQAIQIQVLKAAMNTQAAAAVALIEALPTPGLASSGSLGTLLNVYA